MGNFEPWSQFLEQVAQDQDDHGCYTLSHYTLNPEALQLNISDHQCCWHSKDRHLRCNYIVFITSSFKKSFLFKLTIQVYFKLCITWWKVDAYGIIFKNLGLGFKSIEVLLKHCIFKSSTDYFSKAVLMPHDCTIKLVSGQSHASLKESWRLRPPLFSRSAWESTTFSFQMGVAMVVCFYFLVLASKYFPNCTHLYTVRSTKSCDPEINFWESLITRRVSVHFNTL